jgi:hypothetical protein
MATGKAKAGTSSVRPGRLQVVEYERYIDQQVEEARFHVKLVELVAAVLTLLIGLTGILIALVVIDHWVVGLGFAARLTACVLLATLTAAYVSMRVVPLLVRAINPVYAARMIERSFPALKDSVVNSLLFRQRRGELRDAVYRGIEQQAAAGLSRVQVDAAIDRAPVVQLGYVLLALVAVSAFYVLFSPKSPFQSVARIVAPWREIPRPSLVEITRVQPGDTQVYRGQPLEIEAAVAGLATDQKPVVEYSTADGQVLGAQVVMERESANGSSTIGRLFVARVPDGDTGVEQDLRYRVVAGDAVTRRYRVQVLEAPFIAVDRVQYRYPDYTRLPPREDKEGDLRAVEGTEITIHGRANQPVQSGHIELLPGPGKQPTSGDGEGSAPGSQTAQRRIAALKIDGQRTRVAFRLQLQADRSTPKYSGYRLHFVNLDGIRSQNSVQHSISVIPDLAPVVEVLTPAQVDADVPENGQQRIEIRALDPDFALTRILLKAESESGFAWETALLAEERAGQTVVTFDFVPARFGLRAGDLVDYWAVAEDNRQVPSTGQPRPNRTRAPKHRLRIVAPDPKLNSPERAGGESDRDGEGAAEAETGDEQRRERNGGPESLSGPPEGGEGTSAQEGGSGGGTPSTDDEPQKSDPAGTGGPGERADSPPGERQNETGTESTARTGTDTQGDSQDEGRPSGPRDGERDVGRADGADAPNADSTSDGDAPREPLPSDGSRDGEVVERIQEFIEEVERQSGEAAPPRDDSGTRKPQDAGTGDRAGSSNDAADPENPPSGQSRPSGASPTAGDAERPRPEPGAATPPSTAAPDRRTAAESRGPDDPPVGDGQESAAERSGSGRPDRDSRPSEGNRRKPPGEQPDGRGTGDRPPAPDSGTEPEPSPAATGAQEPPDSGAGQAADDRSRDSDRSADTAGAGATARESGSGDDRQSESSTPPPRDRAEDGQPRAGPETSSPQPAQDGSPGRGPRPAPGDATGADAGSPPVDQDARDQPGESEGGRPGSGESPRARPPTAQGQGEQASADAQPAGDDPNLEYARQATDLVLDYLRDQRQEPDPRLLNELGWDREDVASFLSRWDQLRQQSSGTGPGARRASRELTEMLRGMGLRPPERRLRESTGRTDLRRGMADDGRRTAPPGEYLELYRAFMRSISGPDADSPAKR